jgi:hypothetical protein
MTIPVVTEYWGKDILHLAQKSSTGQQPTSSNGVLSDLKLFGHRPPMPMPMPILYKAAAGGYTRRIN